MQDEPVSRVKLMRLVASCPESARDLSEMPTVVPVTHESNKSDCPMYLVAFAGEVRVARLQCRHTFHNQFGWNVIILQEEQKGICQMRSST